MEIRGIQKIINLNNKTNWPNSIFRKNSRKMTYKEAFGLLDSYFMRPTYGDFDMDFYLLNSDIKEIYIEWKNFKSNVRDEKINQILN